MQTLVVRGFCPVSQQAVLRAQCRDRLGAPNTQVKLVAFGADPPGSRAGAGTPVRDGRFNLALHGRGKSPDQYTSALDALQNLLGELGGRAFEAEVHELFNLSPVGAATGALVGSLIGGTRGLLPGIAGGALLGYLLKADRILYKAQQGSGGEWSWTSPPKPPTFSRVL